MGLWNEYKINKVCNALIVDAQAIDLPFIIKNAIDSSKKRYGGLWVGGRFTVDDNELVFKANALNKALHEGQTDFVLPLQQIKNVSWEFGFISGIISLQTTFGIIKLRCFGAKKIVAQLQNILKL